MWLYSFFLTTEFVRSSLMRICDLKVLGVIRIRDPTGRLGHELKGPFQRIPIRLKISDSKLRKLT